MKFKHKKSSNITLSEKIADALTVKPRPDIEDDQVFATKPLTVSRDDFSSSESEDETAISDFRKRNINLLSQISDKYQGKVISRKDLESKTDESCGSSSEEELSTLEESKEKATVSESEAVKNFKKLTKLDESDVSDDDDTQTKGDDSNESESELESDDYSISQFKKQIQNDDSDDDVDNDDDDNNDDESDIQDQNEGYDISQMEEPMKEQFEHVKKQNVSEEAKKGSCVRNQLLVWESLLEIRIHLQRCLNTANQLPMPDSHEQLKQSNDFMEECNITKNSVSNALDKFMQLQNFLLRSFPETKSLSGKQKETDVTPANKKEESDEEIPSDTDNEEIPSDTEDEDATKEDKKTSQIDKLPIQTKKRKLEDYESEIASSHKCFKSFRDTTIQKWNDKTRITNAANVKNTQTNTVLQQISYILSDKDKLIRKTQLKRSEYDIVGYKKVENIEMEEENAENVNKIKDRKDNDEYISEIFDDSDFYHQLLRELIECKSADISDPVQLSRQWIALQQMRSKMKRKVDTKATKGRKIKYVVHNQLVNYMAPEKSNTWNEESTKELYSSLFGKMFEQNNVGVNDGLSNVFKIKN